MDIIVTTPKSEMGNAAAEAAACVAAGGGEYFRRFPMNCYPISLRPGHRIWYVEDGYIRGFALCSIIQTSCEMQLCETTGRHWPPGVYVFMKAASWKWITPIPMQGFQGFRYAMLRKTASGAEFIYAEGVNRLICVVGGWLDPKPSPLRPCGLRRGEQSNSLESEPRRSSQGVPQ